jgi:hypothetical protein
MNSNTLLIILTLAGFGFGIYYFSRNNSNSESSDSSGGSDSDTEIRTVRNPGRVEVTEPSVPERSPVSGGGSSGGGSINQPVEGNPVTDQDRPDQQSSKNWKKEHLETEKINRQQKKVELVGTEPNNKLKNVNGITRDNLDQTAKNQVSKNLDNGLFKDNKFING